MQGRPQVRRELEAPPAATTLNPAPGSRIAATTRTALPSSNGFHHLVAQAVVRPRVVGKFLACGEEKLFVRGVTYGTFRPRADGEELPEADVIERDFATMATQGVDAVRVYTPPPRELLDAAHRHGLRVMAGLAVERYVGYLTDRRGAPDLRRIVRDAVRACAGHPALLCYAIANEVPASIVRWHGRRRIERHLERLTRDVKDEDPDGLVTYVNYPSTEYLDLPFLDLVSFNVFLESRRRYERYLARLHTLAEERPLFLTEIGLDAHRNGEARQARVLDWQVRSAFESGCAGAFVYSWTDEWHRGGEEVHDWSFGLTRRDRSGKPALMAVRDAFTCVPFPRRRIWPRISVVVCTYNGSATLEECLRGLRRLRYPDFETIVVDDGSTDRTAEIARAFDVRLVSIEHGGLGRARNRGLAEATGEIVAYIDDDAHPDPDWLSFLAATFRRTHHAGVGGPNLAPPGDGAVAECVALAPGNPMAVLLSDREAEHLAGCNMAFRKEALAAIDGFDPRFHAAGDDVDLCWRLRGAGHTLGYSPAAVVWHHRRATVRRFWRQQKGYGAAEAELERKWPDRFNELGHLSWRGRVYAPAVSHLLGRHCRIYYGIWGTAPFQPRSVDECRGLFVLAAMPEWFALIALFAAVSAAGLLWRPLLLALPAFLAALALPLAQAVAVAARCRLARRMDAPRRLAMRLLVAILHLLQPVARLHGRVVHGLAPWRWRGPVRLAAPRPRRLRLWTRCWQAPEERLRTLEAELRAFGVSVRRGGVHDRFDLEVLGGLFGRARVLVAVEEHGNGAQLVRTLIAPLPSGRALAFGVGLATLAGLAAFGCAWDLCELLAGVSFVLLAAAAVECSSSASAALLALRRSGYEAS